uniref:Uncharacterized protein n=1 Tax=Arundo donax TaxID=35708 RepID=A0A0A9GTF3_ARUDO
MEVPLSGLVFTSVFKVLLLWCLLPGKAPKILCRWCRWKKLGGGSFVRHSFYKGL